MSVLMVFCGPHTAPRSENKMEDKRKVSLYLGAAPQAAAVFGTNCRFCWRTTFSSNCAVGNPEISMLEAISMYIIAISMLEEISMLDY